MPETPDGLVVWKNDQDGNDHAVTAQPGFLSMRVVKPGGSRWESGPIPTVSTPQEWQAAFAGLGPKWNQVEGSEQNDGTRYQAVRTTQTPREVAEWDVDHEKIDATTYEVRDRLQVLLR